MTETTETSWTRQELLQRLARAVSETRSHAELGVLGRVLVELEDIEARVKAREPLDEEYRQTLFFDTVAVRELDDVALTHDKYLTLLSDLAEHIHAIP